MKKCISVHTQKIIKYIPFLNCLILFIWLFNCNRMKIDYMVFLKSLLLIFATSIPLAILQIILSKMLIEFLAVQHVLNGIFIYLIPFVVGSALIKYQEKLIEQSVDD